MRTSPIYFILIFMLILLVFLAPVEAVNVNPLVIQIEVSRKDSSFLFSYLYDFRGNVAVETKYYVNGSSKTNQIQREWVDNGNNSATWWERIWYDAGWVNSYAIDYQYSNNQLVGETHRNFQLNSPVDVKQLTYQYADSLLTVRTEYAKAGNLWQISSFTTIHYNAGSKPDTVLTKIYKLGLLSRVYRSVYVYTPNGNPASFVQSEGASDSLLKPSFMTNWYYYPDTKLLHFQRTKALDSLSGSWENQQNIEYTYNSNQQLKSETYQKWKSAFWENDLQYNYVYGTDGTLMQKTLLLPVYNDWRKITSINYMTDNISKSMQINSVYEFWGGNPGQPVTTFVPLQINGSPMVIAASSVKITYLADSLSALQQPNVSSAITVYPNPSSGVFYINVSGEHLRSWRITDLSGKLLLNGENTSFTSVVDANGLKSGIYLLFVKTESNDYVARLIKK